MLDGGGMYTLSTIIETLYRDTYTYFIIRLSSFRKRDLCSLLMAINPLPRPKLKLIKNIYLIDKKCTGLNLIVHEV